MEISESDFDFLRRLSSLYDALTYSATDPVVIIDVAEVGKFRIPIGMFYDVYGDGYNDDLAIAEEIMRRRIATASDDIKKHHKYHKNFVRLFYDVDEALNVKRMNQFASKTRELCDLVGEYVKDIVIPHKESLKDDSFLGYPSCFAGYAFNISRLLGHLVFNNDQTFEGVEEDLLFIDGYINSFNINKYPSLDIKIATQHDSGEGLMDSSLRGRHELNKELLKRIGFGL